MRAVKAYASLCRSHRLARAINACTHSQCGGVCKVLGLNLDDHVFTVQVFPGLLKKKKKKQFVYLL